MQRIILLALIFTGFAISQPVFYAYSSPGYMVDVFDVFPPESYEYVTNDGFLAPTGTFRYEGGLTLLFCDAGYGRPCSEAALYNSGFSPYQVTSFVLPLVATPYGAYFEMFDQVDLGQFGTFRGENSGTLTISSTEVVPEPASYALIGAGLILFSLQRLRCRN